MTDTPATADASWQPLPERARLLFALSHGGLCALPLALALLVALTAFDVRRPLPALGAGLLLGFAVGAWHGRRVHRATAWRLDADGFGYRRGRLWQRETRVPASRVQHIDLRHGPLERRLHLATLVVHTAGSRFSTVTVGGLDADDAARLRDRLALQADADDDA